jgi:hypothetical protein
MNPLVLLGAAIALLAFSGKSNPPTPNGLATQPGTPEDADPLAPTFNNVAVSVKTKTPTTYQETEAAPIAGMSPPAPDSSPPYVYDQISGGPCATGWLGAMDSPAEAYSDAPRVE